MKFVLLKQRFFATEFCTENTEEIFFRVLRVLFSVAFPITFGCGSAAPGNSWRKKAATNFTNFSNT